MLAFSKSAEKGIGARRGGKRATRKSRRQI